MSSNFNFNNNNTGSNYYQNIKFTDEEIKYIANFVVRSVEDKFKNDNIPQCTNNMMKMLDSFYNNRHYKDAIFYKVCNNFILNQNLL
jgi:hypothetical protein